MKTETNAGSEWNPLPARKENEEGFEQQERKNKKQDANPRMQWFLGEKCGDSD
jgi:hypothetical protein